MDMFSIWFSLDNLKLVSRNITKLLTEDTCPGSETVITSPFLVLCTGPSYIGKTFEDRRKCYQVRGLFEV